MSREAMKQPEALRLADALDDEFTQGRISNHNGRKAAVELRRLHERCDQWRDIHDAVVADSDKVYALLRQALEALDSDNPDIQLRAATYLRQALVDADDISEKRVDEKAKRELVRMAREAGLAYGSDEKPLNSVTRFAALVAAHERRACVKVVKDYCGAWDDKGYALAAATRARGEK